MAWVAVGCIHVADGAVIPIGAREALVTHTNDALVKYVSWRPDANKGKLGRRNFTLSHPSQMAAC